LRRPTRGRDKGMNYLSICSGIEAATVAWKPLDWQVVGFSEIESFACSLLQHYYPHVKNYGDMNEYETWKIDRSVDLICGGTPCQDFSIAGLRAGMDGERGNLTLTFLRLVNHYKPRWMVWENVPGITSTRGNPFGQFLLGLRQCGYGVAYRILDAQYFGVPQRRRRVFIVGYFGDWRRAAAILFERESLCGDITPRREKGERVAPTIGSRTKGGGGLGTDVDLSGGLIAGTFADRTNIRRNNIEGLCFQNTGQGYWNDEHVATPIRSHSGGATHEANLAITQYGDIAATINSRNDSSPCADRGMNVIAIRTAQTSSNGCGITDDIAYTVDGVQGQAVAQQVQWASGGGEVLNDTAQAVRANAEHNYQFALTGQMRIRRFTPREVERLFGFPDDFTLILHNGKPASDSTRYKALGNSMAVPVMRWIGERIQILEDLQPDARKENTE